MCISEVERNMDANTDELIPANFTCPITHEAFDEPVVSRDGHGGADLLVSEGTGGGTV